jgi:hypothetical protein
MKLGRTIERLVCMELVRDSLKVEEGEMIPSIISHILPSSVQHLKKLLHQWEMEQCGIFMVVSLC